MPDPADLLNAWRDAIREVGGAAASLASAPAGRASDVPRPCNTKPSYSSKSFSASLSSTRSLPRADGQRRLEQPRSRIETKSSGPSQGVACDFDIASGDYFSSDAWAAPRLNEGGRSHDLQQQRQRGREVNRHERDQDCHHDRHGREQNDPGSSSPTSQPRLGNGQTGRQADCGGHTALRDERRTYPLLPAGSHPRSLAPRPQPIPRQVPTPPPPVPKRLNSILQIRRRQQPPHELIVI